MKRIDCAHKYSPCSTITAEHHLNHNVTDLTEFGILVKNLLKLFLLRHKQTRLLKILRRQPLFMLVHRIGIGDLLFADCSHASP